MSTPDVLPHDEREVVFRADFEHAEPGEAVWISLHFAPGPRHPQPGEWVYLLDARLGGCLGVCVEVTGHIARVMPDWDSWQGQGEMPRPAHPKYRHLRSI